MVSYHHLFREVIRLRLTPFPWRELKYLWWFPVYLATYLLCEQLITTDYLATQTAADALIPFCEWFVIPYCLWYPLLIAVGLWLLTRDQEGYRRYMDHLAVTFLSCALIWLLIPNGQDLRPLFLPRDNPAIRIVELLYSLDTNTNVFPSVHVVGSLCAATAVWRTSALPRRSPAHFAVAVLAVFICLSTLFIKQHALADALGALVLWLVTLPLVYGRRSTSPSPAD